MNADAWLLANDRYLGASLHWLRLKLQAAAAPNALAAGPEHEPAAATAPSPPPTRPWYAFGGGNPAPPPPAAARDAAASSAPAADDGTALGQAAAQRAANAASDPPPALLLLAERLGLSPFERDTVLLCAASELDPDIGTLMALAQGQAGRGTPSFALALQLLDDPSWDALSPNRPLRHARLLEINQPGATPLTAAALRADERIVHFIKGLNELDERLASLLTPANGPDTPLLAPTQAALADEVLRQMQLAQSQGLLPLVQLLGVDAASKLDVARQVCSALPCSLYRLALEALPVLKVDLDALVRLWQRERQLLPIALYLDAQAIAPASADAAAACQSFVASDVGPAFIGVREALPWPAAAPAGGTLSFEVRKPGAAEQHLAWREALGAAQARAGSPAPEDAEQHASMFAGQFDLGLRDIQRAAALAGAPDSAQLDIHAAWQACCQLTRPRLDQLAQRIEPMATWSDLVLAEEPLSLLRQIAAQVRHRYQVYEGWSYARRMNRGLGISALFTGESGTGKTMAAEVIANELRLSLYRIDLSAVVSKYIGETEKNLRRLFDAAEQGGAILLFDEADALFGKRSEVKDSHDRYANIEVNYLLQRMEAFSGLAILATNMKSALDSAFMRRLRFVVNFPFPGPAERRQMWQLALPAGLPHAGLDFDRLARFGLSGGNVHGIVLNAAFMAAAHSRPIDQAMLMGALRAELRKLGRQINEAEFR